VVFYSINIDLGNIQKTLFFPAPTGIEKFKDELSIYGSGKGTLKFPLDEPIPFDLISRIVKFRVNENLERAETNRITR
jgi:uncharacterized protein YdhG (YjbR/CyaY superfamily)